MQNAIASEKILPFLTQELSRMCSFEVGPDTALLSTGLLDSMGLVELIAKVQDTFDLHVEMASIRRESFDTPRMMAAHFSSQS